ncbi:MAG: hypothetical protein U1E28_14450 [Beijerinckiaceae bacterium]
MDDLAKAERPHSFENKLRYIADMSGELAAIAGALRRPMLTYFLNMARVEAEMQITEAVRARSCPPKQHGSRRRATIP